MDTIIEPLKSEEKDGSGEHPRDAIIYYSDNGDVSSPARGGSGQKGSKYGEGKIYTMEFFYHSEILFLMLIMLYMWV